MMKNRLILRNSVIWEVHGVRFIESQNDIIVILVPRNNSVIAGVINSQIAMAFLGASGFCP